MFSLVPEFYEFLSVPFYSPLIEIFFSVCRNQKKWNYHMRDRIEVIILVRTLNHSGESAVDSSSICPREFLQLKLKITSDMEDFLVEVFILLSLVLFGPYGRVSRVGKLNSISSMTIFLAVHNPGTIF